MFSTEPLENLCNIRSYKTEELSAATEKVSALKDQLKP
jgi:hypothetical protein